MPIEAIKIGDPFFGLRMVTDETSFDVQGRAIVLNLGASDLNVLEQSIAPFTSVILQDVTIANVQKALIVDGFDTHADEAALLREIRTHWPSAYYVRREERLRGIEHYMSPKTWIGHIGLTFYHSASVPLNVGLHKDHPFCPVPGFREVHTQIVGIGKMQQCREKSVETLYLEEVMAPGMTHKPMFDADGNYPWHQFETITPSVFLAVEMLPEGAEIPA